MNEQVIEIAKEVDRRGGRSYLVGGSVRDKLFGLKTDTDIDVEVFGLNGGQICEVLSKFGEVKLVGQQFGVWMVNGMQFSLPRTDNKTGVGHKDFDVVINPDMPIAMAQARRDFTINAIYKNVLTGEIVDNWGGLDDVKTRTLRHTSSMTFGDDPLRVLRGVYLCGKLQLISAVETDILSHKMRYQIGTVSTERVWNEIWKWAVRSEVPSLGLDFLDTSGWIVNFPELYDQKGVPVDDNFPMMDCWEYTRISCDGAAYTFAGRNDHDKGCLILAALLAESGRSENTVLLNGSWSASGYERFSVRNVSAFLTLWKAPTKIKEKVIELVREHHLTNYPSDKAVKKMLTRLKYNSLEDVVLLNRVLYGPATYQTRWLEIAKEYGHLAQKILMGRHLIKIGFKPGKELGNILNDLHNDQLEGMFSTLSDGLIHFEQKYSLQIDPIIKKEILDEI